MRNLLRLAIALSIALTDEDVKNLTFDANENDVKNYFGIPEDVVVDLENLKSEHKHTEGFNFDSVARYLNGAEKKKFKSLFPDQFGKAPKTETKTDAEKQDDVDAKAKTKSDSDAKKKAEAEAKAKAKEEAKEQKKADAEAKAKAKEEEKAKKEEEKAKAKTEKDKAKAEKEAEKNKPKPLSRSQEIFIMHRNGMDFKAISEANPEWNQAHIRNAIYMATSEPEKVDKAIEQKAKLDALVDSPAEVQTAEAEAPEKMTEEANVGDDSQATE